MARTIDKIILVILIIFLVGVSGAFISAVSNGNDSQQTNTNQNDEISQDEAIAIALNAVPGDVTEVEIESQHGNLIYEIEVTDDQFERDVKVSLKGEILEIKIEEIENDQELSPQDIDNISSIITEQQAIEIALDEVNGIVIEIELERERGRLIYNVEIKDGRDVIEVEINAETGNILNIEKDD